MNCPSRLIGALMFSLSVFAWSPPVLAVEFGIFKEYSIYTKDKTGFKDNVLLLFHGLKSAHPNGTFRRLEKHFSASYSVVGFNYNYFDVASNKRELAQLWEKHLKGHKITVLGTSLGGFWANYFAGEYDIPKMVLVNPVTQPVTDLIQFIGPQYSENRQKKFTVTAEDVAGYATVQVKTSPVTRSMVFLMEDDPIIDYRHAYQLFKNNKNSEVLLFRKGGHSIPLSDPRYLSVLKVFMETE